MTKQSLDRRFINTRRCLVVAMAIVSSSIQAQSNLENPSESPSKGKTFQFREGTDHLKIDIDGRHVADFVFRDPEILRPYFANVRTLAGVQVTRNHPPVSGVDATDHATMHPGIWYGFGNINESDFWRNKGSIDHLRFLRRPTLDGNRMSFETESQLKTTSQETLGNITAHIELSAMPQGWILSWEVTFVANVGDIVFGDQEEMGFGARVATKINEKNGGLIRNSSGLTTAKATWGKSARWCDYSGNSGERKDGITLLASTENFRESWWHNRDYGVFVANPFGRASMKQGEKSEIRVKQGDTFSLRFGAFIHDTSPDDAEIVHSQFMKEGK